jgi:hypothetical protein
LRKCPNQWCQAAAIVVDVANSIFGGSEAIQSFVQSQAVASTETYSEDRAFEYPTDMIFAVGK